MSMIGCEANPTLHEILSGVIESQTGINQSVDTILSTYEGRTYNVNRMSKTAGNEMPSLKSSSGSLDPNHRSYLNNLANERSFSPIPAACTSERAGPAALCAPRLHRPR